MRKTHAAFGRLADEGDITSGGDDGFTGADRIDAPIVPVGRAVDEEAVTGRGDIPARGDAVGEIDAVDLAAGFQRDGTRRRQRRARIDMDARKGAARIAGERQVAGVASHRGGQIHALAAGETGDGPPVRDAGRRVGAIKGNVTEGGDGGRRGRVEAAIITPAADRDADGPAGSRRGRVASEDRRTEIRAGPLGIHGDPDIPARRPDGLIRDRMVEPHDVSPGAQRRNGEVATGDEVGVQQGRVVLATDRGQRERGRGREVGGAIDLDTTVTRRIASDRDAAVEASHWTGQVGPVARQGIGERPPVGGVHRGDLSVEDDRAPGRDGLTGLETQADAAIGRGFGLAAEADAPAGSRRGRVPGEDVRIDEKSVATGLPGDADVAGLGPDGLRRGAQPYRPVAGGAGRQAVDDDVAVRRDIVQEVDGSEGADTGHGDLLSGLDRRTRDLMNRPAGIAQRVTGHGHAIRETADDPAELQAVAAARLRTRPPIGEGNRRALSVEDDRAPGADRRGGQLLEAFVGEAALSGVAVEGDRAAAGRRDEGVKRGDRPTQVETVAAADIRAGDDDIADERGHGGAVEAHAAVTVEPPGAGDRSAGTDDGDVPERAVDRDIVIADRLDARTVTGTGETEDRDVAGGG